MKTLIKSVVHGFTGTPVGWSLLQEGARRVRGPRAAQLVATLAPPPAQFSADDRSQITREGATFELNRSNYFQWARSLGLTDRVAEALKRLATPGAFWDVGANIGYYSVMMTRWMGASTPVLAVEPGSAALRQLRQHLAMNGADHVVVVPKAVSDEAGRGRLFVHDSGDVGKSSLREETGRDGEAVELTTLDEIWEGQSRPAVGLIKIDVEGLEGEVLLGARTMLAAEHPSLVVEISPSFHATTKIHDAVAFLRGEGYGWSKIGRFLATSGVAPIPAAGLELTEQTDVVFRRLHG